MNTLNLRTEGKNEFEYIFDISPDLILILDKSQTIVRANQAVAIRLGVPVESLAGLKCFQVLHQGDETPGFCPHHQMLNDGKPHTLEIFLESLNGWFSLSVSPLMDKDGNLTGSVHIARDITERKEAEHKLKESEVFHRNLLTKMNGFAYCRMIYQKDQPVDFVYLMVNPAFESLTGLKEVVGKKVSELIPGILDMDPELIQSYGRVAMSGDPETFEIYLKSTEAWFSISVYCPEKEYFVAVFDVITERKVAEMALRESEENLQTIFNATDESIFLISSDKTLIAMNDVAVEMMGKSRQEMTGENIAGLLPPDLRENRLQFIDRALSTGDHISFEDERNGRWMVNHVHPVVNAAGEVNRLSIYSRDISWRKQAEKELIESESKYRLLVENSPDAIAIYLEGKVVLVNRECLHLLAASTPEELIGKPVIGFVHPDSRLVVIERMKMAVL